MQRSLTHGFAIPSPGPVAALMMAMTRLVGTMVARMSERRRQDRLVAELNALPEHVRKDIGWVPWEHVRKPVAPIGPRLTPRDTF